MKKLSIIIAILSCYCGLGAYTAQQIKPNPDEEIKKIETISITDNVAGGKRVFTIKDTNVSSVRVILEGKIKELQELGSDPEDFVKIVNPVVALLQNGLYQDNVSQIYNFCELADCLVKDRYEKPKWDAMQCLMKACHSFESMITDKFKVRKNKRDKWISCVREWNLRYGAVEGGFYKDHNLSVGKVKDVNAPRNHVYRKFGKIGRKKAVNKDSSRVELLKYVTDREKELEKLGGENNAKRRDLIAEIEWARKALWPELRKKAINAHW